MGIQSTPQRRITEALELPRAGTTKTLEPSNADGGDLAARQIIDNDPDVDQIALGRRYLYDGSMVASEYIFKPEAGEGETTYTTLENGYGELEQRATKAKAWDAFAKDASRRRLVRGSILFCAIAHDQDSTLTNINDISECDWAGGLGTVCNDHAFYYYASASGEFAALGHRDDDQKILEYYRNRVFGEVVVLPLVDDGVAGGSTADDGIEDTPDDLSDNNSKMMTTRGIDGDHVGRVSEYGNRQVGAEGALALDATGLTVYGIRAQIPTAGILLSTGVPTKASNASKLVGVVNDWKKYNEGEDLSTETMKASCFCNCMSGAPSRGVPPNAAFDKCNELCGTSHKKPTGWLGGVDDEELSRLCHTGYCLGWATGNEDYMDQNEDDADLYGEGWRENKYTKETWDLLYGTGKKVGTLLAEQLKVYNSNIKSRILPRLYYT